MLYTHSCFTELFSTKWPRSISNGICCNVKFILDKEKMRNVRSQYVYNISCEKWSKWVQMQAVKFVSFIVSGTKLYCLEVGPLGWSVCRGRDGPGKTRGMDTNVALKVWQIRLRCLLVEGLVISDIIFVSPRVYTLFCYVAPFFNK